MNVILISSPSSRVSVFSVTMFFTVSFILGLDFESTLEWLSDSADDDSVSASSTV